MASKGIFIDLSTAEDDSKQNHASTAEDDSEKNHASTAGDDSEKNHAKEGKGFLKPL